MHVVGWQILDVRYSNAVGRGVPISPRPMVSRAPIVCMQHVLPCVYAAGWPVHSDDIEELVGQRGRVDYPSDTMCGLL